MAPPAGLGGGDLDRRRPLVGLRWRHERGRRCRGRRRCPGQPGGGGPQPGKTAGRPGWRRARGTIWRADDGHGQPGDAGGAGAGKRPLVLPGSRCMSGAPRPGALEVDHGAARPGWAWLWGSRSSVSSPPGCGRWCQHAVVPRPPARPAGLYRVTEGVHGDWDGGTPAAGQARGCAAAGPSGRTWCGRPCTRSSGWRCCSWWRGGVPPAVGDWVNVACWYPGASTSAAHYAAAWITIGALVVHVGAKAAGLGPYAQPAGRPGSRPPSSSCRRRRPRACGGGDGQALVPVALSPVGLWPSAGLRAGTAGPPRNKTAAAADVVDAALGLPAGDHRAFGRREALSLGRAPALPQHRSRLPIACVEGWSARLAGRASGCGPAGAGRRCRSGVRRGRVAPAVRPLPGSSWKGAQIPRCGLAPRPRARR